MVGRTAGKVAMAATTAVMMMTTTSMTVVAAAITATVMVTAGPMVTVAVSALRRFITSGSWPTQSLKSPLEAGFFFASARDVCRLGRLGFQALFSG